MDYVQLSHSNHRYTLIIGSIFIPWCNITFSLSHTHDIKPWWIIAFYCVDMGSKTADAAWVGKMMVFCFSDWFQLCCPWEWNLDEVSGSNYTDVILARFHKVTITQFRLECYQHDSDKHALLFDQRLGFFLSMREQRMGGGIPNPNNTYKGFRW